MKNNQGIVLFLAAALCMLSGCEAIEGIFKAGVWSGVLMVVGVVALIIFVIAKIGRGKQ